jgi:hypothetical protein
MMIVVVVMVPVAGIQENLKGMMRTACHHWKRNASRACEVPTHQSNVQKGLEHIKAALTVIREKNQMIPGKIQL